MPATLPVEASKRIDGKPMLLDEVRAVARMRHLSIRTEQAYVQWIRRFILFHQKRHPRDMGEVEIRAFISDLAVNGGITASTQTVALSALLFLYCHVLKQDLPYVGNIERARKPKRLPVVFTRDETERILSHMEDAKQLPHAASSNPPDNPLGHIEYRMAQGMRPGACALINSYSVNVTSPAAFVDFIALRTITVYTRRW